MDKPELKNIPIEHLKPGRYQTRRVFNSEAIEELAESMKAEGLIQPIIVRPISNDGNEKKGAEKEEKEKNEKNKKYRKYEIVAGERRWRAAQLAKFEAVPCLVKHYSDKQVAAITPIENVQREDLNPIEEASAYQHLIDECGYTHEEVAIAVGKSRTKITNLLRLLRLDTRVQELLILGDLNEGHGKIIAGLPYNLQYEFAKKSAEQNWSLRKLDQEIKKLCEETDASKLSSMKNAHNNDPNILALERAVSAQIGSEVKLEVDLNKRDRKNSGWLKIKYFDHETLSGVLERLGVDYDERY